MPRTGMVGADVDNADVEGTGVLDISVDGADVSAV